MLLMQSLAATCEAVAATPKKTEKARLVAEHFRSRSMKESAQAAIFLSGRAFPAWERRTLQVGGTLLWRAVAEVSGKGEVALTAAYRRHGDLGSAGHGAVPAPPEREPRVSSCDSDYRAGSYGPARGSRGPLRVTGGRSRAEGNTPTAPVAGRRRTALGERERAR